MSLEQATTHAWPTRLANYGGFFSVLLLGAIYFSTSLAVIVSVIIGLLWLFSAQFIGLPKLLREYPVAAWALALYICFLLGLSYGSVTQSDAFSMLNKYRELFFISVLIPFLSVERYRDWAWKAFILVSIVSLVASYLMDMGVFGAEKQLNPSIKSRITHSILIGFFAFFCLHRIIDNARYSKLFIILFCLSLFDLFFVVQGRTGQLVTLSLILLFTVQRFGNKGRLLTALIIILSLTLFMAFSDRATRIYEGIDNTQAYLKPVRGKTNTSMGLRYKFWGHSLELIAEKPILGHGTGSFSKEYQRVAGKERVLTGNPHNEFLMITVQLGLLGLFIYGGFFLSQYRHAKALPYPDKWLAQGILLSLLITSVFNTPFLDHTEGHWFAVMIALCFAGLPNNVAVRA
jgi:O-antigen ligase